MELSSIILASVQILAVTATPFTLWYVQKKYQDREAKKDAKLNLFLTLMANRKSNPVTKDWVDALNTIDVVFQNSQRVRSAWRAYFDSLDNRSQHFDNNNAFQLDLLTEIAKDVGYDNLKQTEIDRFYSPQYFGSQMTRQDLIYQEELRIMLHSKSYSEAFSSDEYNEHYNKIMGNKK